MLCAPSFKEVGKFEGEDVVDDVLEAVEEVDGGDGDGGSKMSKELVRFRVNDPASRCCSRSADGDALDGGVIPKAQTSRCNVSLFFGILKARVGVVEEDCKTNRVRNHVHVPTFEMKVIVSTDKISPW